MRISRLYQNIELNQQETVELDKQAAHYVKNVLRMRVGHRLILFNGRGGQYSATLKELKKSSALIEINNFDAIERESPLHIHLGQVMARGEKMDFILQKAVELGVTCITLLTSERCDVKLSTERLQKRYLHWQRVIISACEQCGRNTIPELNPLLNFATWCQQQVQDLHLILNPDAKQKISGLADLPKKISMSIGPEGGFSDAEIAIATQHQAQAIQLGPRVLRTETAALSVLSILQAKAGDF